MFALERLRRAAVPAGVLLLAAAIRLRGIGWGLPELYEEAIPFLRAWTMWGWGGSEGIDPNPHFFHYPSLVFYLQFLGQGGLYLALRAAGAVESTFDLAVLYAVDRTPFVVAARVVTVACAVGTVAATARLSREAGSSAAPWVPALLLAANPYHVTRSQMIEVDVPLTLLATVALGSALRIVSAPTRRHHLLAGLAVGLSASAKYNGALLALPLAVAHLLARREARRAGSAEATAPPVGRLLGSLVVAGLAFAVTSPFVLLDAASFLEHFNREAVHMRAGHFGREELATPVFYLRALSTKVLGIPALALAGGGLFLAAGIRRRPGAIVIASFLVPYALVISTWEMKADRYLLPLLPGALVLAGDALTRLAALAARSRGIGVRSGLVLAVAVPLLLLPLPSGWGELRARGKPPVLTRVKSWIETNVPSGSLLFLEPHGPRLLGPLDLWALPPEVRARVAHRRAEDAFYAVQWIPMFQVDPERSAIFYDLAPCRIADYVVSTRATRARYELDPGRFSRQIAFYTALDEDWERLREFRDGPGGEPEVVLYRNPLQSVPFAQRGSVEGPIPLSPVPGAPTPPVDQFYFNLGLNYQFFGYLEEAVASYEHGLRSPPADPEMYERLVTGITWCLGRRDLGRAAEFAGRAAEAAPTEPVRDRLRRLRDRIGHAAAEADR
jgi:4-amino-4-deoxy-L-arabinose transferase-like glycosyltransferase